MVAKKLFFDYHNFFGSGHISIFPLDLMDLKNAQCQKFYYQKSVFSWLSTIHAKEFLKSAHTGAVFLQFLAKASNGRRHSYFENWCLKLGIGTPEDMLLTNFGIDHYNSIIGFLIFNINSL